MRNSKIFFNDVVSISSIILILFLVMQCSQNANAQALIKVTSPDRLSVLEIKMKADAMTYRFSYHGEEVIKWSALGLLVNDCSTGLQIKILKVSRSKIRSSFKWALGENERITNNYNQLMLKCQAKSIKFNFIVRLFNGSAAFRYQVPEQKNVSQYKVSQELTEFGLSGKSLVYQYNQESVFTPVTIDTMVNTSDFPSTIVSKGKLFISIGEADNHNYAKGELYKITKSGTLGITFCTDSVRKGNINLRRNDSTMHFHGSFFSPWRTISCAGQSIGLHQFSDLNLRLVTPFSAEVQGNIHPGKLIRAQLNTQNGLDCIDFASKHHFSYILFDAGWYGAEFRTNSDPTTVIPQLDLQKVIDYGKTKMIGVILYVNYVGLKAKLDTLLPIYKRWGVAGLKFGFVDGLSQKGVSWLDTAISKVNYYGFVLDIHDNYKPTGLSRKYPYLLTQEGIRGDENSPDAFHTTVLPFTRFLAGPADFTFCFPNPKNAFSKNLKVSKAQQLALTVIFFSPLQSIFWYGNATDYTNEDEIEFFNYVPTVWDKTRYIAGEIGENISVARRKSGIWYMGNAAGLADWNTTVKLDFLKKNKKYRAVIYEDDGHNGIRKRNIEVRKGYEFPVNIKANGGQAVIIRPF